MAEVNAVTKMEEVPPQVFYPAEAGQTTLRCFPGNREVLNGIGKKSGWTDYVRIEKMNESEPPVRCRETDHPVNLKPKPMTTLVIKADYHSLIYDIRGYKVMPGYYLAVLSEIVIMF